MEQITSKEEERMFYKTIYKLTFDKDDQFFYTNNCETILCFLREKFWGEGLLIRLALLHKLLYFDAAVNPPLKKELRRKSNELKHYLNLLQASDPLS